MMPSPTEGNLPFDRLDSLQREGKVDALVDQVDAATLTALGLGRDEIAILNHAWKKLRTRRLARKTR